MATVTRREALALLGTATAGAGVVAGAAQNTLAAVQPDTNTRMRQSVCRWCFRSIPLETFFQDISKLGLTAVDLLEEDEWRLAKRHGLTCSTGYGGGGTITDGLNDPANHAAIIKNLEQSLPKAAQAEVPNVIAFFGNRRGLSDEQGIDNCGAVLERIAPVAEGEDVTLVVELLNSKVDHRDYQGDRAPFGVEVVTRVNSPRVKLVYDIYHMQIMEGDVIRTIRNNHTAGVPGRHEIANNQELNYPAICRAIRDTGYTGYLAHEFIPTGDPMTSPGDAVMLCDV